MNGELWGPNHDRNLAIRRKRLGDWYGIRPGSLAVRDIIWSGWKIAKLQRRIRHWKMIAKARARVLRRYRRMFTREDAERLREYAKDARRSWDDRHGDADWLHSLAARIETLLPPTEDHAPDQ